MDGPLGTQGSAERQGRQGDLGQWKRCNFDCGTAGRYTHTWKSIRACALNMCEQVPTFCFPSKVVTHGDGAPVQCLRNTSQEESDGSSSFYYLNLVCEHLYHFSFFLIYFLFFHVLFLRQGFTVLPRLA